MPQGTSVGITSELISRIADGKVTEDWENADELGMLQQLGVTPPLGEK